MSRNPLPTRRPCETVDAVWQGNPITVSIGMYPDDGAIGEVFADPVMPSARNGQLSGILRDACVGLSVSLQWGIPVSELAKSLGTVPTWVNGEETQAPASPIGTIIEALTSGNKP